MLHLPILAIWFPSILMIYFESFVPIVFYDLMENIEYYTDFLKLISKDENKKPE